MAVVCCKYNLTVSLYQTWKHQGGPSRRIVTDHWFGCKRQAQGISTSTLV